MLVANKRTQVSALALMSLSKATFAVLSISSLTLFVGCSGATPVSVPFAQKVFSQQDQLPQNKMTTKPASLSDPFASSEASAATLTMLAGLSDATLSGLASTDLTDGILKNKCGFVAKGIDISERLLGKIESQGWAQVGQTNMFSLSAADSTKSFNECRCLVNALANAQNVILIPTIHF